MVSEPSKFSKCAQPPSTDCSTVVQPRKPKSCKRPLSRGLLRPPLADCSKEAPMTSRARRLRVATVVGYLQTCGIPSCCALFVTNSPPSGVASVHDYSNGSMHNGKVSTGQQEAL
eukprot:GHUV01043840.1.p1 GENE.GHUV01043840.1~~GHUV01043840.1.p1  ORF type:complete len:115 (+),score=7.50 GHUV01043840.1:183-527(+)